MQEKYAKYESKVKGCVYLFVGIPSQSYRQSPAKLDHLPPDTGEHAPTLTSARQPGAPFTYPIRMKG